MKNKWCNHQFVLTQLETFPDFFRHFDSQLILVKISCQELLGKEKEAIATLEEYLESGVVSLNKTLTISHVNLLCRQRRHLPDPKTIVSTFVKYFYADGLEYQQKLALLIVYFEKSRRGHFEFDFHNLNYFLEAIKSQKVCPEPFFNIFCHYILEFITSENVVEIGFIFKQILSKVKEISNRRYRMLKSMVITETIKWENKDNLELFSEFINLF